MLQGRKYRIYPNEGQEVQLAQHFGHTRFVYNHFLAERIKAYKETGKGSSYYKDAMTLTNLKKQKDTEWLSDINSQSLQQSLRNLDGAYQRFFKKQGQFPIFHKKNRKQSFTVPQHFAVSKDGIAIPKVGTLKTIFHRPVGKTQRSVTISMTPTGKYYASILCDAPVKKMKKSRKAVGIDVGLKHFAVMSDGTKIEHPKLLDARLRKLTRAQRVLSRRVFGSKRREKSRLRVARIHEVMANTRRDWLHKLTHSIVRDNQVIAIEDLNVSGMMKNRCLSRSIGQSGWGEFFRQLEYKAKWYGKDFRKLDKWFPSSKLCNNCSWINDNLKLEDREWTCGQCKTILDRDANAAQNILAFSTVGITGINARGEYDSSRLVETRSLTPCG